MHPATLDPISVYAKFVLCLLLLRRPTMELVGESGVWLSVRIEI